jgi:hypothetical protein
VALAVAGELLAVARHHEDGVVLVERAAAAFADGLLGDHATVIGSGGAFP